MTREEKERERERRDREMMEERRELARREGVSSERWVLLTISVRHPVITGTAASLVKLASCWMRWMRRQGLCLCRKLPRGLPIPILARSSRICSDLGRCVMRAS